MPFHSLNGEADESSTIVCMVCLVLVIILLKVANRRSKENLLKIVGESEAVEDIEELEIVLDIFEKYELPMSTVCVALSEAIP